MSRTRTIGGKLTEIIGGDYNIYSTGDIVYNSAKTITFKGEENGVTFGDPKEAPARSNSNDTNETITNCVIHFRRCKDYMQLSRDEIRGETKPDTSKIYGFDWMREEYKDTYGYYWEGDPRKRDDQNKIASEKDTSAKFENLEKEYSPITIEWKKKEKYYTPWLSLYVGQKARMRLTMDWDDKPKELQWDAKYTHSDCLKLPDPASIKIARGGLFSYQDIEIECTASITEEKEVRLLADGKLAGRIKIIPNEKKLLKITWCLVDISGKNRKGDYVDIKDLKNKLSTQKIERFVKYLSLSQALIDVEATPTFKQINLSDLGYNWDKYRKHPIYKTYKYDGKAIIDISSLKKDCIAEFERHNTNDPNRIVMFLTNNNAAKVTPDHTNRVINEALFKSKT